MSNERIGRDLDCLKRGLEPFVKQKMRTAYGEQWEKRVNGGVVNGDRRFDAQALLSIMKEYWPQVFRPSLGHNRYGLIKEVRNVRNRWAHQEPFSSEEATRALEAIRELLAAVGPVCDSSVVTTWEQIQQNILQLEAYRHSQERQEIDFYKGLIKRGICFVVYKRGAQLLFGPSRFVGYAINDLPKHQANTGKDGKVTNPAIDQVLGSSAKANDSLEKEYLRLCAQLGITARSVGNFGVARRYWFKH